MIMAISRKLHRRLVREVQVRAHPLRHELRHERVDLARRRLFPIKNADVVKTYLGRPENQQIPHLAMQTLGSGLFAAGRYEDSLTVRLTELATLRRVGVSEEYMFVVQGNLANTYAMLRRFEEGVRLWRDVYSGTLKLLGEEHFETLREANNYAAAFRDLQRFTETKSLLLKTLPVSQRVFGENSELTLRMRWTYAEALCSTRTPAPRSTISARP